MQGHIGIANDNVSNVLAESCNSSVRCRAVTRVVAAVHDGDGQVREALKGGRYGGRVFDHHNGGRGDGGTSETVKKRFPDLVRAISNDDKA
jgi:hypothetical protein